MWFRDDLIDRSDASRARTAQKQDEEPQTTDHARGFAPMFKNVTMSEPIGNLDGREQGPWTCGFRKLRPNDLFPGPHHEQGIGRW